MSSKDSKIDIDLPEPTVVVSSTLKAHERAGFRASLTDTTGERSDECGVDGRDDSPVSNPQTLDILEVNSWPLNFRLNILRKLMLELNVSATGMEHTLKDTVLEKR